PPMTWDELYTEALKLTKKDAKGNVTRLGFATYTGAPVDYFQQWLPYFEEVGGALTTPDNRRATLDNAAGLVATKFFVKLFQAMTPGGAGLSSKLIARFESGKIAMEIMDRSISGEELQY